MICSVPWPLSIAGLQTDPDIFAPVDSTTKSPTERQYTRDNKRRRASASTTRSDVLVDFTVKGGQAESGEDLPVEELVTSLPAADLEAAIADAIEANSATLPEGVSVADVVSAPAPQSETSTPVSGNAPTTTRTTDTNDDEDEETIVLVFVLVGAVLLVMFLFSMAVWRQKKHEEATRRYMQAYNRDGSWGTQSGNKMWKGGKQYGGQRAAWDQGKRGYNKNERWHYGAGGSSPSSGGKWGAASKGKNKWAGGTSPATPPPVRPKSPAPGLLGQGNKGSSSWSPHPQGMPGKGGLLASWIY
ncbi:unnamed protein product [Amoebophrya sp. A120]|nr:unnamed protein product [Amoebophrya sp. A120]|eukprot:GSA120T00000022001.1